MSDDVPVALYEATCTTRTIRKETEGVPEVEGQNLVGKLGNPLVEMVRLSRDLADCLGKSGYNCI
jgi:hypothetical protein